jgi:hypothetical protein
MQYKPDMTYAEYEAERQSRLRVQRLKAKWRKYPDLSASLTLAQKLGQLQAAKEGR